jgi:Type II secretion system (T2SS), protein E, N-terminal domain
MAGDYRPLSGPRPLGDRLLEAGLITRTQLDVALEHQQAGIEGRRRLGQTLVQLGFLTGRELIQTLSVHLGIPIAPPSILEADERAGTTVPAGVARRHRAVPCLIVDGCLLVAVAGPVTADAVEELQAVSGLPVLLCLASEVDVDAALLKRYGPESIVAARLRELANGFLRLADGGERLARLLATAERERRELAEDRALCAELGRLRADLEALVRAVVDVEDRLRHRSGADARSPDRGP